ncbi:MAG: mRNA surveillance protein pelota [Candidatus Thermoplasmatota archaeon]|jgi:protein pelota|nr:mRNA surveillance protein pelota [Candidatus Sysuiplasma jiujiangense]MBX8640363.1 mRNA surveillance protein pelota [Candidatus Sysuiplasma jiujiangense]MBX8642149.1 mRNA surveillance protein pelota [Candidatus Sysuiplasma jiujiangense]MCL4317356.1 mRNA surveillance protein pelota [Candidatus Thermoplasmatota archaeon]MCL5254092.1 mRNA surveillance protein pelota [Candidatus Thermoplasmatota archaeon]
MRILNQNPQTGEIKVLVTNGDDLWHLYNIVRPGDRVKGKTFRREEARDDAVRAQKETRIRVFLTIVVERTEFMDFQNILRITGKIVEAEFGTGSYHTFNIGEGSDVIIEKDTWKKHDLERLREAVENRGSSRFICVAIEHGEAVVALVKSFGVEEIATIQGRKSKEESAKKEKDDFYAEIISQVKAMPRLPVLIVGPGFIKEDFLREAREKEPSIFSEGQTIQTGQGGMAGIREALSKPQNSKLLQEARMSAETKTMEEIKELISSNGPVTYGIEEVRRALEAGAVKRIAVTDRMIREGTAEPLLKLAEEKAGEVTVLTSGWDAGKQLDALGGVAAILRYRMPAA